MGGSSKSETGSTTSTSYRPTTLNNPFSTSNVTKKGKINTNFKDGTASRTTFDFVNNNLQSLLDSYMNPSLEDPVIQADLNKFNQTQQQNLQNNIISPLASNNMLRSSQATNMYNNLSNQSADYTNDLIANSRDMIGAMLDRFTNMYSNAYQGMANDQATATNAAIATGNKKTSSSSKAK